MYLQYNFLHIVIQVDSPSICIYCEYVVLLLIDVLVQP